VPLAGFCGIGSAETRLEHRPLDIVKVRLQTAPQGTFTGEARQL